MSNLTVQSKSISTSACDILADVGETSLKELAAGMAIAAIISPFMTSAAAVSVVATTVNIVIGNVAVRATQAFNRFILENITQEGFIYDCQTRLDTCFNYLAANKFSKLDLNRDTLVHELGHYTAFKMLYKGNASIMVDPFQGGSTSFSIRGPRLLNKLLSERVSVGIVAAAGPLFSLMTSLGLIAAAHFNEKESPKLAPYFKTMAAQSLFQHILYAFSAYWDDSPGHDFAFLAMLGIPPIACVVTMVAAPIILKASLSHCYPQE